MLSYDAQDILSGTETSSQQMPPPSRKQQTLPNANLTNVDKKIIKREQLKCPRGMHRELYNLYVHQGRDNNKEKIESLVPSNTKQGYTITKAQFGKRIVRKWHLKPFSNEARNDSLQLHHWEREDKLGQPYLFAQFNKQLDPVTFTNEEYEECLIDPRWTKEETLHLLQLCQHFDLRWPIIVDRFDRVQIKSSSKKTMEDMKERYYGLVNELNAARGVQTEPLAYDAEHERRRKEQLDKLYNRTEEQIKEEEDLKEAIKKIEAKRKDRERKAHDLQRLIDATERVSVSPDSSVSGTASMIGSSRPHRRSLKKTGSGVFHSPMMPPDPHIHWPEYTKPGPHLRSQEMKLPSNTAQRKLNNIGVVTTSLKIVSIPMEYPHASEEIVRLYNEFRSNIVLLQDLKTAVHNTECQLDQLAFRLKVEKEIDMPIEARFRVSDLFYEKTERGDEKGITVSPQTEEIHGKGKGGGKGKNKQPKLAPVTDRRITKLIEVNPPNAAAQTRKRRAQAGVEGGFPPTRSAFYHYRSDRCN